MRSTKPVAGMSLGLALAALMFSQSVRADEFVSVDYRMPVRVDCVVDESDCQNSPGPQVTLSGTITLGEMRARLTFKNNERGTHKATVEGSYDVVLFLGGAIEIPKQPVLGGVGGNPHVSLVFQDGNGRDLCREIYLGRCVQGLNISQDLLLEVLALCNVHADGCSNHPGPVITMEPGLVLSGLHARLIFRNALKGPHVTEASTDVAIILEGSSIELPKQPVQGGVTGNPIVCVQFLDGDGKPIGREIRLGRCNQI